MKHLAVFLTTFFILSCSSDDNSTTSSAIPTEIVGNWSGTFSGDDNGNWNINVSTTGVVSGTGYSITFEDSYIFDGTVNSNGSITATVGTADTGATFVGTLNTNGTCSGTWENQDLVMSGTWQGSKN